MEVLSHTCSKKAGKPPLLLLGSPILRCSGEFSAVILLLKAVDFEVNIGTKARCMTQYKEA